MTIRVRPATMDDAPLIAELCTENIAADAAGLPREYKPVSPQNVYPPDAAKTLIAREKNTVLVAELDGEPAGFAMGEYMRHADTPSRHGRAMIYLYLLIVRPEHRRKGVGTALLEAMRAAAREKGTDLLMLEIFGFNGAGRAFLRARGFTIYNERYWNG